MRDPIEPSQTGILQISLSRLDGFGAPQKRAAKPKESVTIYRPAYAPGVEVWSIQRSERLWRMHYDFYGFSGQDEGNPDWHRTHITIRYRRTELDFDGCRMLLGTPGELSCKLRISQPLCFHAIIVQPEAASHYTSRPGPLALPASADPRLYGLFSNAWRAVEAKALDIMDREHHLRAFLSFAFEIASPVSGEKHGKRCERSVRLARDLIWDRYAESLTIPDIGRAVGLSPWHLARIFHESVGLPIHAYLRQVRLSRALPMLRLGGKISAIAPSVGFADQAHLTRSFRAAFGMTPRAYQRAVAT